MSKISRSLLAASAGVLLLGMSGCALPGGTDDSDAAEPSGEAQPAGLEQFDPCTFFKPKELKSWGVKQNGEESTKVPWEPGCRWDGGEKKVGLQKNEEETVESYEQSGNWDSYNKKKVSGKPAAVARTPGSAASGMGCNVIVDAGGGVAIYQVSGAATASIDTCGEATKIAESTASRLPA